MKITVTPGRNEWQALCRRPVIPADDLNRTVTEILNRVKSDSDEALRFYSEMYDGFSSWDLKIESEEIAAAAAMVSEDLKLAINIAKSNIERFHRDQLSDYGITMTTEGVDCWRKRLPVEKVGLYVPGGSAPLFSTLLMLGIPARIAGCSEIIVCTPPDRNGMVSPVILYIADLLGINSIYRIGGAQAIAAMAYGTGSVPAVYKIFGPGNQYVTKAKELVQNEGIAIDMPAGPSEVLVIADSEADATFVAADLLSQAEHGKDSQVVLLSDNMEKIGEVIEETKKQLLSLPRKEIVAAAIENSRFILLPSLDDCMDFSNAYAPEHLIINCRENKSLAGKVLNAGSVFLGAYSCESAGDYASGTNHTLPTNGYARSFSGVSASSFMKEITFQEISRQGLMRLGPAIETMASAESLDAHRNAVTIRLNSIKHDQY